MSTMVKRVAQALQQEMGTAAFDETASFALHRAAIAAMREPRKWLTLGSGLRAPLKRAMIDAALEGK